MFLTKRKGELTQVLAASVILQRIIGEASNAKRGSWVKGAEGLRACAEAVAERRDSRLQTFEQERTKYVKWNPAPPPTPALGLASLPMNLYTGEVPGKAKRPKRRGSCRGRAGKSDPPLRTGTSCKAFNACVGIPLAPSQTLFRR